MDAESSICLSDLVPALRWSRPKQVAEVLADPRLPSGWWASVTLPRAIAVMGLDWLCDRLARLSASRWDHLPLADVVPALHTLGAPELARWPGQARAVVERLGGWPHLCRLTPGDLATPAAAASAPLELVVGAVFHEVLTRIPTHPSVGGAAAPTAQAAQAAGAAQAQTAQPQQAAQQTGQQQAQRQTQPPGQQQGQQQAQQQSPQQPHPQAQQQAQGQQHPQRQQQPHSQGQQETQPTAGGAPLPTRRPAAPQAAPQQAQPAPAAQQLPPHPAPTPDTAAAASTEFPLIALVDGLLRGWEPLEQAVAVERLFAADPISLRALAHRLGVDREMLSQAQRRAEERVLHWLRSPDSSALTGHLFRLTEWLGAAATEEQLVGADPAHPVVVPILRTQLWRVLVTLMPDRRLQDGWLVVGDLGGLRDRTRQMLAGKPSDADVVEMLAQLGIRSHSARAWLDSLHTATPAHEAARHEHEALAGASGPGSSKPLPRRTPGVNGHNREGRPVPQVNPASIDPSAALATLSALSGSGRPHLTPGQRAGAPSAPPPSPTSDPRRWQRIEVTSEHLRGEPVAVPEGYAAQLGMRPGTLLSVTGPGDNAVVLVWRDRQPVFDSLQPVLMRLNARPGDQVYVTVDGYRLDAQLT
ncbi:hypothetical protein [Spongiactinospora sp. TRM90649]|uniref:hypothetical protein n=1 Tax=Spongiactinospora sp. TRM90649 TaxID=3031114 RepID=UPI0023F9AE0B|nr:hypothetical protein [Spongiactinospora sp. TRM90649]MDF5752321.1 hypothetical protein [Spongiactinospora sp. TRM90649]